MYYIGFSLWLFNWSFKLWHFIWYGFNAILECELIGVCSTTSTSHEHRYKFLVLPNK